MPTEFASDPESNAAFSGVVAPGTSLLVVMPAFNEGASLAAVVRAVGTHLSSPILVVSDASDDNTVSVAREACAQVIELSQQLGAWGATQAGIRFALDAGYMRVATLDADGQHDPACLPELIEALEHSGADVVIGTCPGRLSPAKRLAWAWFRMLTGLRVEDLTSGLRIYGPRALEVLASPEATLLEYQDVGVLLLLRRHGLAIHEVAVTMYPRSEGSSRVFSSWLTVARYMLQTTLLCVARIGRRGGQAPLPHSTRDSP